MAAIAAVVDLFFHGDFFSAWGEMRDEDNSFLVRHRNRVDFFVALSGHRMSWRDRIGNLWFGPRARAPGVLGVNERDVRWLPVPSRSSALREITVPVDEIAGIRANFDRYHRFPLVIERASGRKLWFLVTPGWRELPAIVRVGGYAEPLTT